MRDPLFIAGMMLVLGCALWPGFTPAPLWCLCASAALFGLAPLRGERPGGWVCAWAACFWLGAAAPGLCEPGPELRGQVSLRAQVLERRGFAALVTLHELDGQPASGPLLLQAEPLPEPGAELLAFGQARSFLEASLPGEPDLVWESRLSGVRSVVQASSLRRLGPAPAPGPDPFAHSRHRALLRSLVFGDLSDLSKELRDLLRQTGTSHLVAVSGLHMSMLGAIAAGLAQLLLRPLALLRPRGVLPALPPLLGAVVAAAFGMAVGWPVSARRSAIMFGGVMLGRALGREAPMWGWLGFSAALMVLHDPAAARSVSFALSFGALAGMMAFTPNIERLLPPDLPWILGLPIRSLATTLGATLGTLPACAWHFQSLPLSSPISNLVAIPLTSAITLPAGLLASSGHPWPLWVAEQSVDWLLVWLRWTEAPCLHPAVGPLGALGLALAAVTGRRMGLGLVLIVLSLGLRVQPVGVLQVDFLSIGQGDAALLRWPDGRRWLIDGGPDPKALLRYLRRENLRRLDEVWLSHPHPDHSLGLGAVLQELEVGHLRIARLPRPGEDSFAELLAQAVSAGVQVQNASSSPGMQLLGPPSSLLAQRRSNLNEESLVMKVQHGRHSLLFTGDIERRGEEALARIWRADSPLTVLKVAHHGSDTSSSEALLRLLRPSVALISCGPDNRYGHPDPVVLQRLQSTRLLRTDQDGTVQLRSDGQTLRLRTWRPGAGWSAWEIMPEHQAPGPNG